MSISVQQTPAPCGFPQSQVLHIHCRHSQIRCYGRAVQRNLIANCLSCSCHEQGVEVLFSRVYSLLFAAVSVFTPLASFQFTPLFWKAEHKTQALHKSYLLWHFGARQSQRPIRLSRSPPENVAARGPDHAHSLSCDAAYCDVAHAAHQVCFTCFSF